MERSQEFLLFSNDQSVDSHICTMLLNYYRFTVNFDIQQSKSSFTILTLLSCLSSNVFILPGKSYYQVVKIKKKIHQDFDVSGTTFMR